MSYSQQAVAKILRDTRLGKISSKSAFSKLKNLSYETLPFARIDHHRSFRKGFPEAVYAPGKTLAQMSAIILKMKQANTPVLVTRLEEERYRSLRQTFPDLKYCKDGRIAYFGRGRSRKTKKYIAVVTGGTADLPVAEEAALTLEIIGKQTRRFYDCGVAGLHRIMDCLPEIRNARAIICVAGMEGALPSVLAGLVDVPVIAVPTSIGYGAHFEGLAPLLTMMNSCAQGVAVVNIDNGYGAACFAAQVF